ncbi:hypothetical protein ACJMK2_012951, partial [Sinanodonta woodiana]
SVVIAFGVVITSAQCPIGTYDTWSQWSACNASCGGGTQKRWQSLCCPPDASGNWADCRATYNLTEIFQYDVKPCNQLCSHGTFINDRCICDDGYTGLCCSTDIDECASTPCQHGGSCVDGVNRYHCTCVAGFTGSNCET